MALIRQPLRNERGCEVFRLCKLVDCSNGKASLVRSTEWQREYTIGHFGKWRLREVVSMIKQYFCRRSSKCYSDNTW